MGAYSIFKVCMCQYGDANSSSNWRRVYILRGIPKTPFMDFGLLYENNKGEYVVLIDVRMADIPLASLVYFLVYTFARVACLLHSCFRTSRFNYSIWATPK